MPYSAANLAGWLNEPRVQSKVIAYLQRADAPVTCREVAVDCGLRSLSVNRVLLRLHKKGAVSRYKLPMQRHRYCFARRECVPGAATRKLFVYELEPACE